MIGQVHLAWIDRHLCQIYPIYNDNYFGGLNILLVGDFHQLPPVGQAALYSNLPAKPLKLASHKKGAYEAIDQIAVLDQVMRQGNDDVESFAFKTALIELCNDFISDLT